MSTVLLTSVGGLPQVSVIQHLRTLPEVSRIIGYDAGGYYGAAESLLDGVVRDLPEAAETADVVLCCGDRDAEAVYPERAWILNKPTALDTLRRLGVSVPGFVHGNLVEKPARGSGGRGQRVFDSFVMQYMLGQDWSVDVLLPVGAVVARKRMKVNGASTHGVVVRHSVVEATALQAAAACGLDGLCNVQMISTDNVGWVYEVNPRISGSIMLSVYAGVDLLRMEIRRQLGLSLEGMNTVPRDGATMHRYYSEAFSG